VNRLSNLFVCPQHGAVLAVEGEVLTCPTGTHHFPIRNGIPRFVDDSTYSGGFGTQWHAFPRTQLDSHSGLPISRDRLLEALREDLWKTLPGSQVLEVGCGAGRFTEILLSQDAEVWSVDLSSAVDINVENCPLSSLHTVLQADLDRLPFKSSQFDLVLCLGVLQHTPSPEASILHLSQQVRQGGTLVLDHYVRNWGWVLSTKPLARLIIRQMSHDRGLTATNTLYRWFAPLYRLFPTRLGRVLINRISPITFFTDEIPELSESQKQEWGMLDTHDSLTDHFKHRRTATQLSSALRDAGLIDVTVVLNGGVLVCRGTQP
jgi:2-polyprenyl-3-methyl-5-hydroxy-6-metoxy-1,4-benzoquinol methylase/uncharacterized protein YbaR (Trm112 family)